MSRRRPDAPPPPPNRRVKAVRKAKVKAAADLRRSAAQRMPRRAYHLKDQMRAAFLAGRGYAGQEIADEIGGTTGPRVRAMLRKCGINMPRGTGDQDLIPIRCKRRDRQSLFDAADTIGVDPYGLALTIIRRALADQAQLDAAAEAMADE